MITLCIDKKEDIIIPFTTIGDSLWEENTRLIIASLADNWGNDLANPKSEREIQELEARLETNLPNSLKEFYKVFGVADIGEELISFDEIDYIGKVWEPHPEYGPRFSEKDLMVLPYLITFSDYLGNGNMFCFHKETKEIYYFDHDSQPYFTKMLDHFDDYLKGCLIFAQADLFGEVGQDKVDQWTEEIVEELIGTDLVRKWRY